MTTGSVTKRTDSAGWRVRWWDDKGERQSASASSKAEGNRMLAEITIALARGTYIDPITAQMTLAAWCETWIGGYSKKTRTVRQARVHIKQILRAFPTERLSAVRPSDVKSWTVDLKDEGYSAAYIYALHGRLSQIMGDAVFDGILPASPCSRKTSPATGGQIPYVATTEQIWALYDAYPEELRAAVLLGAFAGLRLAEAAALRPGDVDFMRGIITPAIQWPDDDGDESLKTECSRNSIAIPADVTLLLSAAVRAGKGDTFMRNEWGQRAAPWVLQRAMRDARATVDGLPPEFRFQDLRHYLASLLIDSGLDIKQAQAGMRHSKAATTLDTYGHLFKAHDDAVRAAVSSAFIGRSGAGRRVTPSA